MLSTWIMLATPAKHLTHSLSLKIISYGYATVVWFTPRIPGKQVHCGRRDIEFNINGSI